MRQLLPGPGSSRRIQFAEAEEAAGRPGPSERDPGEMPAQDLEPSEGTRRARAASGQEAALREAAQRLEREEAERCAAMDEELERTREELERSRVSLVGAEPADFEDEDQNEAPSAAPGSVLSPLAQRKTRPKLKTTSWRQVANTVTIDFPAMEGFLDKMRPKGRRAYQQRYFILQDGLLTYCKSREDHDDAKASSGTIELAKALVVSKSAREFTVEVADSARHFELRAIGEQEAEVWIKAIKQTIQKLQWQSAMVSSSQKTRKLSAEYAMGGGSAARCALLPPSPTHPRSAVQRPVSRPAR